MLTERRSELERRVNHLSSERDTMAASLEEAQDRILMLEKHKYEQERQVCTQQGLYFCDPQSEKNCIFAGVNL